MSEELEFFDQTPPPSGAEMTAFETWIAVVTKPNANTFAEIAAQPGATTGKAFLWAALSYLVTVFFGGIAQTVNAGSSMEMLRDYLPPDVAYAMPSGAGDAGMSIVTLICAAPFGAIFGVMFFAISVALILWVAKLFGGNGEFEKMAYTFAAIMVPMAVVNAGLSLLSMIPFIGLLFGLVSFAVSIYSLVLHVLAVQAVTGLDTGKSAASVILPWVVFFFFMCCCAALLLGLTGAAWNASGAF